MFFIPKIKNFKTKKCKQIITFYKHNNGLHIFAYENVSIIFDSCYITLVCLSIACISPLALSHFLMSVTILEWGWIFSLRLTCCLFLKKKNEKTILAQFLE